MTHNHTVRSLQVINHLLLLTAVFFGDWNWFWLSLGVYWFTGVFGINIGLHRLLSHRSFKTSAWKEKILGVIAVLTTVGSPLAWVAVHRQHHRSTETPLDPHSPYQLGNFRAWFGLWKHQPLDLKLVRDLRRDSFQKFLHRRYLYIILVYCVILAVIDPWLVIYAYAIPACMCFWAAGMINVWSHVSGYRNHATDDLSKNNIMLSVITLGEGWHNTHHAHPARYKQGEKWWELDPPSWVIRLIKVA